MTFDPFRPIDWGIFFVTLLNGVALGMAVAVYLYLMIRWVMRGKTSAKHQ